VVLARQPITRAGCLLVFGLLLLAHPANVSAQDLPAVRDSVDDPSRSWHWADADVDGPFETLAGAALGIAVAGPYVVPHVLVDRGFGQSMEVPAFPYAGTQGYLQYYPVDFNDWPSCRATHMWGGRVSFEGGDSFDDQQWLGGRLQLDAAPRLGIEADLRRWKEVAGPWQGDRLWIGEADATFRFAQNEHWMFRSGLGMNWLTDDADTDLGVNFTYGFDWFPVQPLVFSSEIDIGTLGDAWLFHARTSAGVTWRGAEFYVAYDYYDIGDGQLKGLAAGLRLWF
jgi:hypothetical protein